MFVKILSVPSCVLLPGVTMIAFVGIYSLTGSSFDMMLMVAFGVLGYICRKIDIPTVPIILGILLGNQMEDNLRRAMGKKKREELDKHKEKFLRQAIELFNMLLQILNF